MRLTCPNCGAQYEVPDEVIPDTGRDVQCSNCGDTWFQHHPDHALAEDDPQQDADAGWDADPAPGDVADPVGDHSEDPPAPEPEPARQPEIEEAEPGEPPTPARRELSPEVSDVLREEAEREREARAQESGGLEHQPELGLDEAEDEAERRSREARTRMARLRGESGEALPDTPDDDGPDPGTRRNLLPDIDEINSSLNSDEAERDAAAAYEGEETPAPRSGGGFRRGFRTIILLAVIGLLLYVFAPRLAGMVPALEAPLAAYVEMVNAGRAWLDQTIGGLMGTLDGMSSEGDS